MNRTSLTGRLVRDPELRTTGGGTPVCVARIAVDARGEDDAMFIDVESYGASGEAAAKKLSRGDLIGVDGRIEQAEWQAKDGSGKRSKHYVVGRIEFLQLRGGARAGSEQPEAEARGTAAEGDDSEIPF